MIEKKLTNLANSIADSVVKKYVLGFFLDQLSRFLPNKINFSNKNYKYKTVKSLEITKNIFEETKEFTSNEIKEFSLLYVILNNLGNIYLKEGNLFKAENLYLKSLSNYFSQSSRNRYWNCECSKNR